MENKLINFERIDSTHKYAKKLIEDNKIKTESIIVAEYQTDGIGRSERKWESRSGNLYTSILKKFKDKENFGQISLVIACAIREAILRFLSENNKDNKNYNFKNIASKLFLHWPNDIYYIDKKISGMLLEVINGWLIISIGINVNNHPKNLNASSLYEIMKQQNFICSDMQPLKILKILSEEINKWFINFQKIGFLFIKNYWLQYINDINCNVIIRNGKSSISGVFKDIDFLGRLVLETKDRKLYISSGDLFIDQERVIYKYE